MLQNEAAAQFKAGASTVACRRRRQVEEALFIAPSEVEKYLTLFLKCSVIKWREIISGFLIIRLVPSKIVSMNQILPDDDERMQKREIESSFNTAPIELSHRAPRFFFLFSSTSTRTSTITIPTSYAFVTTTIKTSVIIESKHLIIKHINLTFVSTFLQLTLGAAGALLCLPSNYQLC